MEPTAIPALAPAERPCLPDVAVSSSDWVLAVDVRTGASPGFAADEAAIVVDDVERVCLSAEVVMYTVLSLTVVTKTVSVEMLIVDSSVTVDMMTSSCWTEDVPTLSPSCAVLVMIDSMEVTEAERVGIVRVAADCEAAKCARVISRTERRSRTLFLHCISSASANE